MKLERFYTLLDSGKLAVEAQEDGSINFVNTTGKHAGHASATLTHFGDEPYEILQMHGTPRAGVGALCQRQYIVSFEDAAALRGR